MTLPFRRRHHDNDASHDRARALLSDELDGPLDERSAAWLEGHFEHCPDCREERDAYAADRALLRGLRATSPEPPRDLWARTSAALDQASPARRRPAAAAPLAAALGRRGPRGVPLGPLAGVLVAAIVLVFALRPAGIPIVPGPSGSSGQIALATPPPGATPITPLADRVAWVQSNGDGQYSILFADVDQACPDPNTGCADLVASSPAPLELGAPPKAVVLSPHQDAVAVVGADGEAAGSIVIVSVPTPSAGSAGAPPSGRSPVPSFFHSLAIESAAGSPLAPGSAGPAGTGHAIIQGVIVVGRPTYSSDGQWFAFSARPADGSRGPDLYAWHVGDEQATRLSDDGATYFAGWYRDEILASGVTMASATPLESTLPSGGTGPVPPASPSASASAATALGSVVVSSPGPAASPAAVEAHPFSFLLDPATGGRTEFARPDVWLPAIDPEGRFVTYWAGTVTPEPPLTGGMDTSAVTAWRPAAGDLVLDGWSGPLAAAPASGASSSTEPATPSGSARSSSPAPSVSPEAAASHHARRPSSEPSGSASPAEASPGASEAAIAVGPAGTPIVLASSPIPDFDDQFDPRGTRLAVWIADPADPRVGTLQLIVLDPAAGGIDAGLEPLPATVALRGFSIDEGRLGWVTPSGQDGQPSTVRVLAWLGDEFGKVQTVTGAHPQIVR